MTSKLIRFVITERAQGANGERLDSRAVLDIQDPKPQFARKVWRNICGIVRDMRDKEPECDVRVTVETIGAAVGCYRDVTRFADSHVMTPRACIFDALDALAAHRTTTATHAAKRQQSLEEFQRVRAYVRAANGVVRLVARIP